MPSKPLSSTHGQSGSTHSRPVTSPDHSPARLKNLPRAPGMNNKLPCWALEALGDPISGNVWPYFSRTVLAHLPFLLPQPLSHTCLLLPLSDHLVDTFTTRSQRTKPAGAREALGPSGEMDNPCSSFLCPWHGPCGRPQQCPGALDLLTGQPWVPDLTVFIAGDRNVVDSPKFEAGSREHLELH